MKYELSTAKKQEVNKKAAKNAKDKLEKKIANLIPKRQRKIRQEDILNLMWLADPKKGILDPTTQMPMFKELLRLRKANELTKRVFNKFAFTILIQEATTKHVY